MNNKFVCVLALSCLTLFAACGEKENAVLGEKEKEISVESIAISQPSAEMEIGETLSLKATVSPSNAKYDGITWTSTKTKVASVSESGLVSALSEGNTIITVMAGGKKDQCSITVNTAGGGSAGGEKPEDRITEMTLSHSGLQLVLTEKDYFDVRIEPKGAIPFDEITWSVADNSIATISIDWGGERCWVEAINPGVTTVTATVGSKSVSGTVWVSALQPNQIIRYQTTDGKAMGSGGYGLVSDIYKDGWGQQVYKEPFTLCPSFRSDRLKTIIIPEGVEVMQSSFKQCVSLTTVSLPNSLKQIMSAFEGCTSLESIVLKENVEEILSYSFKGCTKLRSIQLSSSLRTIGVYAFEDCKSLSSISLPNSLQEIGEEAFHNCISLKTIKIPSVSKMGEKVFSGCGSLESVVFSDGLTEIGEYSFYNCSSLTTITLPTSLNKINKYAFRNCSSLKTITIPQNVSHLYDGCFLDCVSLTSISFSDGIEELADGVFSGCTSMKTLTLPSSVSRLGVALFEKCDSLKELHLKATSPPWFYKSTQNNGFYVRDDNHICLPESTIVYVPKNSFDRYKLSIYWRPYQSKLVEE